MIQQKLHSRYSRRRAGSLTIEALVAIPLLVIATFAVFQFAGTLAVEQSVANAATSAARETGKDATDSEIITTVELALEPYQITLGPDATLIIERFGFADVTIGTLPCSPPATPVLVAGEVRVTVCVSLGAAPLSQLLASFGLDFSTRQYQTSSLVRSET